MNNLKEIFGTILLFTFFGVLFWVIFTSILSGFLRSIEYRFKRPIQNRFKNKMTPIYKLKSWFEPCEDEDEDEDKVKRYYWVTKWELEHTDYEVGSWQVIFIPFSVLFQHVRYVEKETFDLGILSLEDVENINLEAVWQKEFNAWQEEKNKKTAKKDKLKDILNKKNENFNKNYIE